MSFYRVAAAGIAAIVLGAALPAVASATDYCVGATGCAQADSFGTLEQALATAESTADADRVLVGPGEHKAQAVTGFSYDRPDRPVEIIGAGRGQTVLTGLSGGSGNVLFLNGGDGTSIHDLTIRIPANVAAGYRGLTLKDAARRIEVVQETGQTNSPSGVLLANGGTLSDSTVTMTDWGTKGVAMEKTGPAFPPNVIRDSTIAGVQALYVDGGGRVERSYLIGETPAVYAMNGLTEIESSLLRITDTAGTVAFVTCESANTQVRLEGDTLVGTGPANITALHATTSHGADHDIDISIRDSILDAALPIVTGANGPGGIRVAAAFSAYDPSKNQLGGITTADQTDILRGDPGFTDRAGWNFRLRPDSPLVDAGAPDAAQGIDLDGNPLLIDGNGDGSARRDIGAYEAPQPPSAEPPADTQPHADTKAPVISGFRAAKTRLRVAHGTRLRYTLSENARVTLRFQRIGRRGRPSAVGTLRRAGTKGLNRIRFSGRIGRRVLRPGRYRIVARAVDAAGNRSAPSVARFRIIR
jgi:hypothetical protein